MGFQNDLDNPLIAELLKRTEENREQRRVERLADYYRRNFKDYFAFQAGNMRDLSPETRAKITKWLKENDESVSRRRSAMDSGPSS